jgi:RimJ/RimL family protein N-acetyltransferase
MVLAAEQHADNCAFVGQWTREQHEQAVVHPDVAHRVIEFAGEQPDSGRAVGFLMLVGLASPHQSIELRRLVVTEKGRGYGRAALRLARALAFESYGAHRLWLDAVEHNQRALALYRSEGFIEEGRLRECYKYGDQFVSLLILSLLRPEYERLAPSDS